MPDNIWYHDYQIVKVNPPIEIEDGMIADLGDIDEFQEFVKTVSFRTKMQFFVQINNFFRNPQTVITSLIRIKIENFLKKGNRSRCKLMQVSFGLRLFGNFRCSRRYF